MTDDDMRVSLREYFEALRAEDQKALALLGREVAMRLDRLDASFNNLQSTVESFHQLMKSQSSQDIRVGQAITAIIAAVIGAAAAILASLFTHR